MLLGVSCDYSNAILESKKYNVLQIKIGDLNNAKYEDDEILNNIPDFNIPIFIHSKLCYNISKRNINYPIKKETQVLSKQKYGRGIIIHLSKWYKDTKDESLKDIVEKINILLNTYKTKILIETGYNKNHLGSSIDDLAYIFKYIKSPDLNVCLDTSHLYISGHPIDRTEYILEYLTEFEIKIGLDRIKLIHLNDTTSLIFGKHEEHLSINKGNIFKPPSNGYNKSLNYFISFCEFYDIPIILERKSNKDIDEEIFLIEEIRKNLIFENKEEFDILIKNSIALNFTNKIIEYNKIMNKNNDSMFLLKKKIYDFYNKNKSNMIKTDNNFYMYNFDFNYSNYFHKLINSRDYNVFNFLFNDTKYSDTKELLNVPTFDTDTVNKLYNNDILTLNALLNLPTSIKKKVLTPRQQKVITNFKYIFMIDYNVANQVVSLIKKNYTENDISFLGSYYRIKNGFEKEKLIKDIDILCTSDSNKLITILKSIFKLKTELIQNAELKSFIFSNIKGEGVFKKINYFIIKIHLCKIEEEIFMKLYLKGPKEYSQQIFSIAKAKRYKMNNKSLIKNNEKIFFETERELLQTLDIA